MNQYPYPNLSNLLQNPILNHRVLGLPKRIPDRHHNHPNIYKEQVLDYEGKIYLKEQSKQNFVNILHHLTKLSKALNFKLQLSPKKTQSDDSADSEDIDSEKFQLNITQMIQRELKKERPDIRVKNKQLARRMKIQKVLTHVKENDPIFILEKLRKMETHIEQFKFLEKQSSLSIIPESLFYLLRSTSIHQTSGVYPMIQEILSGPGKPRLPAVRVEISGVMIRLIKIYLQVNYNILHNRLSNLNQILSVNSKSKQQVRAVANDFFYDQKLVNKLIHDYDKIKPNLLKSVLNTIENHINAPHVPKMGFEYNDTAIMGLKPITGDLMANLLKKLK